MKIPHRHSLSHGLLMAAGVIITIQMLIFGAPLFSSPGTATEGQAFFLLMEAAAGSLHLGTHS